MGDTLTVQSFTTTYDNIYDDDNLTGNEKFHLDILHRFYNKEKGYAYPSIRQIMIKASSKNKNQTRKVLDSLQEKGYIKILPTPGVGTKYYLIKNYSVTSVKSDTSIKNDTSIKIDVGTSIKNDTLPVSKMIPKKEYKKNNKKNNRNLIILIDDYTSNKELKEAIKGFISMRKDIKKQMNEKSLLMLFNKLDKLSTSDDIKIKILEQSIFYNWQGVFPLKENQTIAHDPVKEKPKLDEYGYEII